MSDIIQWGESTGAWARTRLSAYVELTKPRIGGMVVLVTALGFYLALPTGAGTAALMRLAHTLIGTALVASGANALNQYIEACYDRLMERTQDRPLPSGRLSAREALLFALTISIGGVLHLLLLVNALAAAVAAASLLIYVFLYTPLKRKTWTCVFVGAISGALPPVIGWAAGSGTLTWLSAVPFAVLFFWQLPHFAAIAWLYRDDYACGGYPLLPVVDPHGSRSNRHMFTHTIWLIAASVLPVFVGLSGITYTIGAVVLGSAFLAFGVRFALRQTRETARLHILASVVYLPLLFALMIIDKTPTL